MDLTIFWYFVVVIFSVNGAEHVPVLLWESPNPGGKEASATGLSKMSSEEFSDVLAERVDRNPVVVLFSEETLSVEDFSRQHFGVHGAFPSLKSVTEEAGLQFIPAVQSPGKALNRLSKLGYKWEEVTDETLPEGGKKILVVSLDDAKPGEDRSKMLTRHDKQIASLYRRMVDKYSDVLAIYTGEHPSWIAPEASFSRSRRDTDTSTDSSVTLLVSNGTSNGTSYRIMLYSTTYPVMKINGSSYNLTSGEAYPSDVRKTVTRMPVVFKLDNSTEKITLRFKFVLTEEGYWNLNQTEYEDTSNKVILQMTSTAVLAGIGFSFTCGSPTIFENSTYNLSLTFSNIQVQPFLSGNAFGPVTDCVPFFTIGIWSGLLVTFLLLFIVGWGIDMMMNIHTMDRFDDPKGKPLVFNAQE